MTQMELDGNLYDIEDNRVEKLLKRGFRLVEMPVDDEDQNNNDDQIQGE